MSKEKFTPGQKPESHPSDSIRRTPEQHADFLETLAQIQNPKDDVALEDIAKKPVVITYGIRTAYEPRPAPGEPAHDGEPEMRRHLEEMIRLTQEQLDKNAKNKNR